MASPRFQSWLPIAATAVVALLAGYLIARVNSPKGLEYVARSQPTSATAYAPDPERQKERKASIDRLINGNWFRKVEIREALPTVWVEPVFSSLSDETKQSHIGLVFAYHYPVAWATGISNGNEIVVIRQAKTNREVGTYSMGAGLRLD